MKQKQSNLGSIFVLIILLLCCSAIIFGVFSIGQYRGWWWAVLVTAILVAVVAYLFFTLTRTVFDEHRKQKVVDEFNVKLEVAASARDRYLQTQAVEQLDQAIGAWEEIVKHESFSRLSESLRYSLMLRSLEKLKFVKSNAGGLEI